MNLSHSLPAFLFLLPALAVAEPASANFEFIGAKMQGFVERGEIAGAVTLVEQGAKRDLRAVGQRDLDGATPMETHDLFWIASMTKPMTAVCVMMLADEGKLSIDDTVDQYLPEFRDPWMISEQSPDRRVLVRAPRAITIRDLLTHTSGLGDVPAPRPHSTLAELAMAYAREPLLFPPGARWQYCNSGINTLGRIVEIVSGEGFADFLQRRLFDPLNMKDTTFWPVADQAPRIARAYGPGKDGVKLAQVDVFLVKGGLSDRRRTPYPAGGLFSTAEDVAKFYRMMLAGGQINGRRYLHKETVEEMTRTQTGEIKTGFTEGMSWGLGFQVVKAPQGVTAMLAPGTFGHGGAYGTQSWADPKRSAIYILMIQRAGLANGDASAMRDAFQTAAMNALGE